MDRVSKAERELVRKIQKQTNADRIRAMTDEELAEWIVEVECEAYRLDGTYGSDYWLKWLKQEVSDGDLH